jgi:molybdenum cofactor cytidylyltransferase
MPGDAAAIVLAAGASRRLGTPKQLVPYRGRSLLEHVVAAVSTWPVSAVVVVLGSEADRIVEAVEFGEATVAINEEWERGVSGSLRVGLDILLRRTDVDMAFVALGDQPEIPQDVPRALVAAAGTSDRQAIVPVYRYEPGNPVLFRRGLWDRLMTLEGDSGAAELLRAHPQWVEAVRVDYPPPRDIDTKDDIADLDPTRRGTGPTGARGR